MYFIQHDLSGPIKIGRSMNPWARVMELQTGNPFPLRILAWIKGGHDIECTFHERFSSLRISDTPLRRSGGRVGGKREPGNEWFSPSPELMSFIEHLSSGWR